MPQTTESIAAASRQPWPAPDPGLLQESRPDLPDFPLDALPAFWRTWASETAEVVGAPVGYIAQALLASVAGACGAGVMVRLCQGWDEPLILWLVLVGGPAHGKSPALRTLRRALAGVEKTTAREGRGPQVIDRAIALPNLLAAAGKRPAGALLWRDDPGQWLADLARNGRHQPVDVGPLLDSWSPLRTALGPGSPAVSMIGCLDPARFDDALSQRDGLAARLLYAWPKPAPYRCFLERAALRESDAVNALQRIASIAGDPAAPLALTPDEPALRVFDRHLAQLHRELQGRAGLEAAWLGKSRGTVARLAAALGLLHWSVASSALAPAPRTIGHDTMSAAASLWGYFRRHARAVLVRRLSSQEAARLGQVLAWLQLHKPERISRRDVRRQALGQALDARRTQLLIDELEEAGCLRKVATAPGPGGGRPALRWDVNPRLIGGPAAETAGTAETPADAAAAGPRLADGSAAQTAETAQTSAAAKAAAACAQGTVPAGSAAQ